MKEDKWDIVLRPKRKLLDLNLKASGDIEIYFCYLLKETLLSFINRQFWVHCGFYSTNNDDGIYIFVFGNIAKLPTDGLPQPLFYLSGINYVELFFRMFS